MAEKKLTDDEVSWLMANNGRWFWKHLKELSDAYKSDAVRTSPFKKKAEDFEYFRYTKDIASARATQCEDILAFVQQIVDSAKA